MDICLAETFLVHGNLIPLIASPQHFGPMHGIGVDGAAVVKDDSLDGVVCNITHDCVVFGLFPIFISITPTIIHINSRTRVISPVYTP